MSKEYKCFSMELAGRTLTVDINRVAKQANGAAFIHYGDTTLLCTATASEKPREGIDFFPLSVEYEEKLYAVGKIPGGFNFWRANSARFGSYFRGNSSSLIIGKKAVLLAIQSAMITRPVNAICAAIPHLGKSS